MDRAEDVVYSLCAFTCLAALLYKLYDLRADKRDQALLSLIVAFGFKTVSLTLAAPRWSEEFERGVGVPNLGALGVHVFGGVLSSAAILIALDYWTKPSGQAASWARIWSVLAIIATGALAVLWVVAQQTATTRSGNFLLDNSRQPVVAVYMALYLAAFSAGLVKMLRVCTRFASLTTDPWLRRGLRVAAVGACVYLVYCAHRAPGLAAVPLHERVAGPELLTPLCIGAGIPLIVVGLTIPSWGPRLPAFSVWLQSYRSYQTLYPLWLALCRAIPRIALDPPTSSLRRRLPARDLQYRLYRCVIEIQDGFLALRPFMDSRVSAEANRRGQAAGLKGDELAVAVQAERIVAALRAKESGIRLDPSEQAAKPSDDEFVALSGEISWLSGVALRLRGGLLQDNRRQL